MGIEHILLISVAYVIPMALLGVVLSHHPPNPGPLKIAILLALPVFYSLHYQSLLTLPGWPSQQSLPNEFTLLGQQIQEPNKRRNIPGHIRLWAQAQGHTVSRLYELPYSKALHQKLAAAQQRQAAGKQQQGRRISANATMGEVSARGNELAFSDKKTHRPPAKTNQRRRTD